MLPVFRKFLLTNNILNEPSTTVDRRVSVSLFLARYTIPYSDHRDVFAMNALGPLCLSKASIKQTRYVILESRKTVLKCCGTDKPLTQQTGTRTEKMDVEPKDESRQRMGLSI